MVANIIRTANVRLLPVTIAALAPGGIAIFAGMESSEAEIFRPALAGAGLTVIDEVRDAGWWAVAAQRR